MFPLRIHLIYWWIFLYVWLEFFSCSIQYAGFVMKSYWFSYDIPWGVSFPVSSIWCSVCLFYLYGCAFSLDWQSFFSMIMLKIWSMSLTWDSSPSSMPIYNSKIRFLSWSPTFPVCSFPEFFLLCFSLFWWIFLCCLFIWPESSFLPLRPDTLFSAWLVLLVILRIF